MRKKEKIKNKEKIQERVKFCADPGYVTYMFKVLLIGMPLLWTAVTIQWIVLMEIFEIEVFKYQEETFSNCFKLLLSIREEEERTPENYVAFLDYVIDRLQKFCTYKMKHWENCGGMREWQKDRASQVIEFCRELKKDIINGNPKTEIVTLGERKIENINEINAKIESFKYKKNNLLIRKTYDIYK